MTDQRRDLDDIDGKIVETLQRDARVTNRSLAQVVHLAPSTTLGRVRDLEGRKVITGYHAEVDLHALGRHIEALVFVKLRPKTNTAVEEFVQRVLEMDAVLSVHLLSGADDALLHVAVPTTNELRTTVLADISTLPGVVDERTSLIFQHFRKHVIAPVR